MILFGLSANYLLEFIHLPVEYILATIPFFTKKHVKNGAAILVASSLFLVEELPMFLRASALFLAFAFTLRENRDKFYAVLLLVIAIAFYAASRFEKQICEYILAFQYQPEHIFLLDGFLVLLSVGVLLNEVDKQSSPVPPSVPKVNEKGEKIITMTQKAWHKMCYEAHMRGF